MFDGQRRGGGIVRTPPRATRALPTATTRPRNGRGGPPARRLRRRRWRQAHSRSPPVAHGTTMAPNVRRRFDPTTAARLLLPLPPPPLLLLLLTTVVAATAAAAAESSSMAAVPARYTNQFAVRVAGSGGGDVHERADALARKHGFVNRGQVSRYIVPCVRAVSRRRVGRVVKR